MRLSVNRVPFDNLQLSIVELYLSLINQSGVDNYINSLAHDQFRDYDSKFAEL